MSLLRPMAKPSLERGSVNVTLTSLYVWINHKLQVASKSIASLSNRTNSWNFHGDVDDDGDVDGVGGKVCDEEFAKEVACSPRRLPLPLPQQPAGSLHMFPSSVFFMCFLRLSSNSPNWLSSPKMFFISLPSLSPLLLAFFSSFTPSLLHPICLIISLAHFQLTPHLKVNTHPLASVSHDSEVIGQMHHLVLLPRIILIPAHIVWGDPGIWLIMIIQWGEIPPNGPYQPTLHTS